MKKINIQQTLYNTFGKWGALTLRCNHCDFKSPFSVAGLLHIKRKHPNQKITKKDIIFCIKYNLLFRILRCLLTLIIFVLAVIVFFITLPFWWIHEQF